MSLSVAMLSGRRPQVVVGNLFRNGEQGVWYDPSDMTTMFTDSAGSTPVTAVEQPVGKILDKSGRGNHATQATTAQKPVLSARKNLLTKTEDFANAAWGTVVSSTGSVTKTPLFNAAPDGTITACRVVASRPTTGDYALLRQSSPSLGSGAVHNVWVKSNTTPVNVALSFVSGGSAVISVTTEWQRFNVAGTASSDTFDVGLANTSALSCDVSIWQPSFSTGPATTYQRVNTATDYDTVGFPHYLKFDGVDDGMTAPTTPTAQPVVVWVGGKLNGATAGYSRFVDSNSAGRMVLGQQSFTTICIYGGSAVVPYTTTFPVGPAVFTGVFDGVASSLRQDGILKASGNPGTGALGTTLYIGSSNTSGERLDGKLYFLIVRGAATDAAGITAGETYTATKTGVTL